MALQSLAKVRLQPDVSMLQLTPVKALVGSCGHRRILLGQLRYDAAGTLQLEDISGRVPISLDHADTSAVRGYLAEGMCVLAEGDLLANGTFKCTSLADPPMESRERAKASLQGLNITGAVPLRCAPCLYHAA